MLAGVKLPQSMAVLGRLGAELERRWAARRYRPGQFAELAADCLREYAYHEQFDEDEITAWVNRAKTLPPQFDPRSSFGQPPLTVWSAERFVLDLYFWVDTQTSIHDHAFAGAFTNLSGHSLNCIYQFEQPQQLSSGVLSGSLHLLEADYMKPGDVCPIFVGPKFIHRSWHLDCPTITLVARTIRRIAGHRQHTYFTDGLAVEYRPHPPIEFQRRREFLGYLFERRHPRRVELAEDFLRRADLWERYAFLRYLVERYMNEGKDTQEFDGLLARLSAGCGPWLEAGLAALRSADPLKSIDWHRLRRREHRLLIALLSTFDDRRTLTAWLARHGYGRPWREQVTDWLTAMDADKALPLHLGSARREIIAQLLRGRTDESVLRELRKTYAITEPEAKLLRQGCKRFRALPLVKPLLRARTPRPNGVEVSRRPEHRDITVVTEPVARQQDESAPVGLPQTGVSLSRAQARAHLQSLTRTGYAVMRSAFDRLSMSSYATYALLLQSNCLVSPRTDRRGFSERYGDLLMESVLLHLQPAMEQATGLRLLPTYSFMRIYETGAVLPRHTDRHACEISASLTIGYDAPERWPMWLQREGPPQSITLAPGDLLIYKGREVAHWREQFQGRYWIQAFFHYVDAAGALADHKYDGRDGIGSMRR